MLWILSILQRNALNVLMPKYDAYHMWLSHCDIRYLFKRFRKEPLPYDRKNFLAWSFFETSVYGRAESPLSNDTKLVNFHMGKYLKQSIWEYMGSYWSSICIIYFQNDWFNFFPVWKFTSLVSLKRGHSALPYTEVPKKLPAKKLFRS